MIHLMPWIERQWAFTLPVGAFPAVLERLRGTPARAADLVAGVPDVALSARPDDRWSAKEHLGHLNDLHVLDMRRVREFLAGAQTLSAADMTNRRTYEAGYLGVPIDEILATLRRDRHELVEILETLGEDVVARTAMHPRLRMPVRLIDWAQFVAEHDDHHLATGRAALRHGAA
jgi:hypothetical protein